MKRVPFAALTVAALLVASLGMLALAPAPAGGPPGLGDEEITAQACTHGNTRWVRVGCCSCNYETKKKLQWCSNGVWMDTGVTDCFWTGSCCSYPCCF